MLTAAFFTALIVTVVLVVLFLSFDSMEGFLISLFVGGAVTFVLFFFNLAQAVEEEKRLCEAGGGTYITTTDSDGESTSSDCFKVDNGKIVKVS